MQLQRPQKELSLNERDRRYSLLREMIKREGLDALIVTGASINGLGTAMHYLTQIWGNAECRNAVIFPVEGEPVILASGKPGKQGIISNRWIQAENTYGSQSVGEDLAKHIIRLKLDKSRVGIDSFTCWPTQQYISFTNLCPDVHLVEARKMCSEIRACKSDEELALMEEAIRVQELAQRTFIANIKKGLTELELLGKVEEVLTANNVGKKQIIFMISSISEPGNIHGPGQAIIKSPNPLSFSPEFAMKRGYAAQVQRMYCWEEPKGEYKRMFELCDEIRQMALKDFRPGLEITKAGAMLEDIIREWGFEPPTSNLGHGLGISYGEDPYITSGPEQARYEEWTIMPREVYVVHPRITMKGQKPPLAWFGDMYFIGEDSTKWMTPFLPNLPEIIP